KLVSWWLDALHAEIHLSLPAMVRHMHKSAQHHFTQTQLLPFGSSHDIQILRGLDGLSTIIERVAQYLNRCSFVRVLWLLVGRLSAGDPRTVSVICACNVHDLLAKTHLLGIGL